MAREHMGFVEGEIGTPFGRMRYAITQDDHVHLSAGGGGSNEPPRLTVNRVDYYVALHLYRQPDGTWIRKDANDPYMSRSVGREYTSAAHKKAYEGIREAWERFIMGKEDLLAEAERSYLNNEIGRTEEEAEKVRGQLAQVEGRLSDLLSQEADVLRYFGEKVKRGGWPAPKEWSPRGRVPGQEM